MPTDEQKVRDRNFWAGQKNGQIHETEKGRSLYMKVCYTAGPVKKLENCFSVSTNAVEIRIWFLTDDILRIRAGFDGDWDETAWSRLHSFLYYC